MKQARDAQDRLIYVTSITKLQSCHVEELCQKEPCGSLLLFHQLRELSRVLELVFSVFATHREGPATSLRLFGVDAPEQPRVVQMQEYEVDEVAFIEVRPT